MCSRSVCEVRIGIASDHGGFELKTQLTAALKTSGYEVVVLESERKYYLAGSFKGQTFVFAFHSVQFQFQFEDS